ncbi:MAG: hypothetical protein ACTSVZ_01040 [Promethearchaeota archaeon]
MMPYGNDHTRLAGIIREIQKNRAVVEFPQFQKQISIPQRCIHSKIHAFLNQEQELEIDTWYLKKNRIIPLFEPTLR